MEKDPFRVSGTGSVPVQILSNVEIRDHFPVSRHEEIQVKVDETKPAPSDQSEMHIFKWHIELEPQSEKIVICGFTVKYPHSMRITGLQD
jgi:hypothetical protein